MRITGYSRENFERVVEISDACYTGHYRPDRATLQNMVGISDVFLAKTDTVSQNKIIGFCIVKNTDQPYIWSIAVDPDFRGRGVGGNLLREVIRTYTLQKQRQISLHVDCANPAQKLYYDYGFRVQRVAEKYFAPNDGLVMVRNLP